MRSPGAELGDELRDLVPAPGAAVDEDAVRGFLASGVTAEALAATPQDAIFHAEGDVWTHTRMVLASLVALPAWQAQGETGRMITFVASMLHDVGKPATTREDGGRLTSRGHSARGELDVRDWLWQRGVPFGIREHVCALIRHHQVPFFGIDRGDEAPRLAARLSLRLRHDWLALVAEADARGRRCADDRDQQRIVDQVQLWRELCGELGVLERPRVFASDHTRVVYLEGDSAGGRSPDVLAYDDTSAEVIVMAGLPACGKDSWLRAHRPALPVVSLDAMRAELDVDADDTQGPVLAAAREAAREHLRAGRSFAWNATNIGQRVRAQIIQLMRDYRARVHVVYCEAPAAVQHERNRRRASPVPQAAIARMRERWTVPALDDAHAVTYAVEMGPLAWPPSSG